MAKQQQRPQARPQQQQQPAQARKAAAPAPVRRTEKSEGIFTAGSRDFIFGRQNFILFGIAFALIMAGLIAMSGGAMPDPNKWEPERIYGFQRITLAPILMVAGFVTIILGIFKKSDSPASLSTPDEPVQQSE
jgi:uncharacterized membrane protein